MLDLARHIVIQKSGHFEPDKFEDQYETALIDLINQKRAGKPIAAKERPRGENVVDLMEALRRSLNTVSADKKKPAKAVLVEAVKTKAKGTKSAAKRVRKAG